MYNDITGIILSGGKSKRMGMNKSLLKIGNKSLIEIINELLSGLFANIILSTNEPQLYKFLKLKSFKDIYINKGPLSGIHSGLINSKTNKNFIISCDMPFMTSEMIEYLVNCECNKSIIVAKAEDFVQQLCGLYDKSCLPIIEKILSENIVNENRNVQQEKRGCQVLELINRADTEIIDAETLPFYNKDLFFNMNSSDDYSYVKTKFMGVHKN
ncbi:MAG: molybdenum cofactor guanylyltransferase [Ignavibacteria bacterium]|nr:molybdenum cofactor guanylyltransferase [Ignavibacteria bacterium]